MPTTNPNNCTNCKHSWYVGLCSTLKTARCDNRQSRKFRMFLELNATCANWQAVEPRP